MIVFYNKKTGEIYGTVTGRIHTKEELNSRVQPMGVPENEVFKKVFDIDQTKRYERLGIRGKRVVAGKDGEFLKFVDAPPSPEPRPNSIETILIDLTQPLDIIWTRFSKTTRHCIKKTEKSGLIFREIGFNERELARQVLEQMEDEKDIYLAKHFLNVRAAFLDGARRAYVVEKGNQPIAVCIITSIGGTFTYSLAGVTKEGREVYAGYFMVWNLIKDAKEHRVFHTFDFGGLFADWETEERKKVNEFKTKWGGKKVLSSQAKKLIPK